MGATPNLGLPWPDLPSQADGPAAFQALATATENRMSTFVNSAAWNGDLTTQVPRGTQVTIFSQDVAVAATGWAWIDINIGIAVTGTLGNRFPGNIVQNAGGQLIVLQNTIELRRFRWHSRQRSEFFYIGGGCALALPVSTTLIQLRVIMSTDGPSDTDGGSAYEYNVGLTQFGAAR